MPIPQWLSPVWVLAALFILTGIGCWRVRHDLKSLREKVEFIKEYRRKFIDLVSSQPLDQELYTWLTKRVNSIQRTLGSFGVMDYKPAFASYMHKNYPVIPNVLPEIRSGGGDRGDIAAADDCLLRGLGFFEEILETDEGRSRNPIIWLREGVREVLALPLFVLGWLGVISTERATRVSRSRPMRLLGGIFAAVTLFAAVITIVDRFWPTEPGL